MTNQMTNQEIAWRVFYEQNGFSGNKVAQIKELRARTSLGLYEAKNLIDECYNQRRPNDHPSSVSILQGLLSEDELTVLEMALEQFRDNTQSALERKICLRVISNLRKI